LAAARVIDAKSGRYALPPVLETNYRRRLRMVGKLPDTPQIQQANAPQADDSSTRRIALDLKTDRSKWVEETAGNPHT